MTYRRYENLFKGHFSLIDLEAITVTNESRARKTQLEIMPRNEKALAKFVKSLKKSIPAPSLSSSSPIPARSASQSSPGG